MATEQIPQNLPPDVVQALGNQIGFLITNTIFALWASDDEQAARANIEIIPVPDSALTRAIPRDKISPVIIRSKNARMAAQFPDCMILLLPTAHAQEVCRIAFDVRRAFLDELSKQSRGIDVTPSPGPGPVAVDSGSIVDQLMKGKPHA
jgi:hypothetical protein